MKSIIQLALLVGLAGLCSTANAQNITVQNNGIVNDTIEFVLVNTSEDTIYFAWIVVQDETVQYSGNTSILPSDTLSMKFLADTELQSSDYDMEIDENPQQYRLEGGPEELEFAFGPNPVMDLLHIQCATCDEAPTRVDLIRSDGQLVWSGAWTALPGGFLDVRQLTGGLYFLRIQSANGAYRIEQLVKAN